MKAMVIKTAWTVQIRNSLRALGYAVDSVGGIPVRSVDRNPRGRRTKLMIKVSRIDGAGLSTADARAIRGAP